MAVNAGQRRNQYSRKPKRKKPEFLRSRNENRLGMTVTVLALVIINELEEKLSNMNEEIKELRDREGD